uniref:Uncharacterized protein n=1 Tax=Avena sativa TaxID=4498 RepID=A0ACD5VI62_AVESA
MPDLVVSCHYPIQDIIFVVRGAMSLSSGYVVVPRCPLIFYGTNYAEFVGFIRIHMRGIRLWGVLSGEVPCPPRPVPPVAPTSPTLPVAGYDQQVSDYSDALSVYRDDLSAYTQWCDEDARAAAVFSSSVLPQFASEFMSLSTAF